jgi:serine/threonine-protein kinase
VGNFKEALRYYDTAIRLSPHQAGLYALKAFVILGMSGDLVQARAAIEPALRLKLDNHPYIAYVRAFIDIRAGAIQEAIQRVSSESWEAIEGQESYIPRPLLLAQLYGLAGQSQQEKKFYENAAKIILAKVRQFPDKAPYRSALGIAYAGLGRKQDAIREAKAGVELKPVSKDVGGYVQLEVLARIYASVGEQDEALRLLEQRLSSSKFMDIRSLRQDPEWKPLRDNPKFQALLLKYGENK